MFTRSLLWQLVTWQCSLWTLPLGLTWGLIVFAPPRLVWMWVLLSIRLTEQCIYGDCGSHQEPVQFLPEWQYVQRVVVDTAPFFSPLEEVIRTHFLPALLGVPLVEIDVEHCQPLTHSVKLGTGGAGNPQPCGHRPECSQGLSCGNSSPGSVPCGPCHSV